MTEWALRPAEIGDMPPEWGSEPDLDEHPDTDIRCTHRDAAGQCLDHQGHAGDHQPPAQETT